MRTFATSASRRKPAEAARLIAGVIADREATGDGWVFVDHIGHRLRNVYPDFDQRTWGHAKLSDLIRATGRFEVAADAGGVLRVRAKG